MSIRNLLVCAVVAIGLACLGGCGKDDAAKKGDKAAAGDKKKDEGKALTKADVEKIDCDKAFEGQATCMEKGGNSAATRPRARQSPDYGSTAVGGAKPTASTLQSSTLSPQPQLLPP